MIACAFCGEGVDINQRGVYSKIEGWVQAREQGGAHGVTFRHELGEYAHDLCVRLQKMGIHSNQGSLFQESQ